MRVQTPREKRTMQDDTPTVRGTLTLSAPNPEPLTEPTTPLAQRITALAEDTSITPQQLATACTVLGIMHDASLDVCATALVYRIDELAPEAVAELAGACERYVGDAQPYVIDTEPDDPGTLPTVAVEYQKCPSCKLAIGDRTFKLSKDSRRPVPGSPDCRYTYGNCTRCELRVKLIFYSEL